LEDHEARAEPCPATGTHNSGRLGFERVGEGQVARVERGDQAKSKRNGKANGRAQPEHTAVDLSGQVHGISRKKQNKRVTAPVRH
jgi:hypothetical protein